MTEPGLQPEAPPESQPAPVRSVLLYDANCRFCRFAARTVERLDREERIAFLPFDDAEAMRLLGDMPDDVRRGSIHLVEPGGARFSRGAALTRLISLLGGPGSRGLGRAYEPIARNRGRFGKHVPDGRAPRRYP
jgi:predicted DCC family thiol-disulfide oxidoreductase YuxK